MTSAAFAGMTGMNGYIAKPIDVDKLIKTLSEILK